MKVFYQALFDFRSIKECVDFALNNSFDGVELGLSNPYLYQDFMNRRIDFSIPILAHAVEGFDLLTPIEEVRKAGIDWLIGLIEKGKKEGVKVITIHLGPGLPFAYTGKKIYLQEEFASLFAEKLEEILATFASLEIVAVENVGVFRFGYVRDIVEKYLKRGLKLTWDLGHTFLKGDRSVEEDFFIKNREHIANIHIHDNCGQYDEHNVIGTGKIDFRRIMKRLSDWDGFLTIEVRPKEAAVQSLKRLRELGLCV